MPRFFPHFVLTHILFLGLLACQTDDCRSAPDASAIDVDVELVRWDEALFQAKGTQQMSQLLRAHPNFAQKYLHLSDYPADSVLINQYTQLVSHPSADTLYQQTKAAFGDLSALRDSFQEAFRLVKYHYPEFTPPTIYTTFTGLGTMGDDLFVSDSMIVISLEFFIGPEARYRPQTHDYLLNRYRPASIVPSCLLLLSNKYNATDQKDQSLLAEMVFYGKSYHFVQQMMPCLADSTLFGYQTDQMARVDDHQPLIWSHFVDNELLFKNDHTVKTRYLGDRPSTVEINSKIPGQIGRWLGHEIVAAYAETTGTSLTTLMKQTDAQAIFRESKYRP